MWKRGSYSGMDGPMYVSGEEEQDYDVLSRDGDKDESSDTSLSLPESPPTLRGANQGSFAQTPVWPQSYRQSMDIYSSFGSPSISSLSPSAAHLSSSYLSSSQRRRRKSTENLSSLHTSLLSIKGDQDAAYDQVSSVPPKLASFKFTKDLHGIPPQCSATQATLNGINVLCGVGILTTPYALKEGGWLSLGLFFVLAAMSFYTGLLLRRCLDCQPGLETYPDIGQAAFGMTGRFIVSIFLYMELYGGCVEYLILEGDNLASAFPNASVSLNGVRITANELFAIITALCVLPTVWLRDLSLLSYISAAGVCASIIVVVCVTWIGVVDGVGFHNSGPLLNLSTLSVSIGLYGYCYSGHSVFPNIYTSLKEPFQFPKVLAISFAVCTIMYGGMATMGFTMFGDETQSQITLSLPQNLVASKIALWSTIVNPLTKYALTITPVALSLEELLPSSDHTLTSYSFSIAIRTGLVVSTLCVALLLPFFEYVMAFIGSFLSMMLCLVFPASCFLKLAGKKLSILQKVFCTFIIVVGAFFCVVGTYSSVAGIIKSF